ncbi:hypothetical protein BR93DRAFT_644730 [Coniochaeta sp. PMI_546]|nr:hypothetical protein BR93DRAFT_644730 [Coniochaeta sp. PMI_546]
MALTSRLSALNFHNLYTDHILARPGRTLAVGTAAIIAIPLFRYAASSYAGYLALGKGGLPHNIFGWLLQASLQPFAKWDLTTPAPYRDPKVISRFAPHGRETFLPGPLPERPGPVPVVPGYVAPQRQTTARATAEMQRRMREFLDALVLSNKELLVMKPSALEGVGTPAVFLRTPTDGGKAQLPVFIAGIKGETVHIHHDDGSTHVTLSLADAEQMVTKGWGRRHKLSGVGGKIPYSYVLVYAPRNEEEFVTWKGLVTAGCAFVTGKHDIQL